MGKSPCLSKSTCRMAVLSPERPLQCPALHRGFLTCDAIAYGPAPTMAVSADNPLAPHNREAPPLALRRESHTHCVSMSQPGNVPPPSRQSDRTHPLAAQQRHPSLRGSPTMELARANRQCANQTNSARCASRLLFPCDPALSGLRPDRRPVGCPHGISPLCCPGQIESAVVSAEPHPSP